MPKPAPDVSGSEFDSRRKRLGEALKKRSLSSVLVTLPVDIAYLTGFRGSAGVGFFTPSEAILWVDPRYTLQAHEQAHQTEIIEEKRSLMRAAGKWMGKKPLGQVGFEEGHLTAQAYFDLQSQLGRGTKLIRAGSLVAGLRMIKGEAEIAAIREAGRVTAEAFEETRELVRPGMCEADLAAELEYRARRKGAEGMAFETIVASGPRAAHPHALPSRKLLEKCDLVIVDVGAIIRGYAADMTRTLFLGMPDSRVKNLYNSVWQAQRRGVEMLGTRVPAGAVDSAVREALESRGLARYFTHSTGHGVGLEIHEAPRVGKGVKTRIGPGCVVTIEPGIYLEGFGGIRIEDTVVVGAGGPEIVTPASKARWFVA
jgi:Xaa-Pro aminopeptidase